MSFNVYINAFRYVDNVKRSTYIVRKSETYHNIFFENRAPDVKQSEQCLHCLWLCTSVSTGMMCKELPTARTRMWSYFAVDATFMSLQVARVTVVFATQ